jgi:ketosteroid isomerase-like protein
MTFRETLDKHLAAIRQRDLAALRETLPAEALTLVMSDGRLVQTVREFLELHRGWFEQRTWSLGVEMVWVIETADLGVAVLHLDYRDKTAGGKAIHETSYLTLAFARQDGRWVMVLDQNTPRRSV